MVDGSVWRSILEGLAEEGPDDANVGGLDKFEGE